MQTPWMFVTRCSLMGLMLPEVFVAFGKGMIKAPFMMNVFTAVGSGLIAASFVY